MSRENHTCSRPYICLVPTGRQVSIQRPALLAVKRLGLIEQICGSCPSLHDFAQASTGRALQKSVFVTGKRGIASVEYDTMVKERSEHHLFPGNNPYLNPSSPIQDPTGSENVARMGFSTAWKLSWPDVHKIHLYHPVTTV